MLPAVAAAIAGGGLSLAGGLFSNKKNIDLSKDQMRFQERMASTQYQRAANDLEKAGLNRILALGSPAASPAGARPNITNPTSEVASSAKNVGLLKAQADLLQAQARESDERRQVAASQSRLLSNQSAHQTMQNALKAYEVEFFRDNPLFREMNLMNNSAGQVMRGLQGIGSLFKNPGKAKGYLKQSKSGWDTWQPFK